MDRQRGRPEFGAPPLVPSDRTASASAAQPLPWHLRPGQNPCTRRFRRLAGGGSLADGVFGCVLPPGSRPLGHRQNLRGQPGQVPVIEGLDVRVGRGPLRSPRPGRWRRSRPGSGEAPGLRPAVQMPATAPPAPRPGQEIPRGTPPELKIASAGPLQARQTTPCCLAREIAFLVTSA